MKRGTTNASTRHPCVCMARINLCCLILSHSICTLITSKASLVFDLKNGALALVNC